MKSGEVPPPSSNFFASPTLISVVSADYPIIPSVSGQIFVLSPDSSHGFDRPLAPKPHVSSSRSIAARGLRDRTKLESAGGAAEVRRQRLVDDRQQRGGAETEAAGNR